MRKVAFVIIVLVSAVILLPHPASAHVLLRDNAKSIGAVLHVVPDDDPIAGQSSTLFFDIQTGQLDTKNASLTITNEKTFEAAIVPVTVTGTSVSADYVFPEQGVYTLSLTVLAHEAHTFTYTQRVSRGTIGDSVDTQTYPLAQAAFIFSGATFLLLVVLIVNHRKDILKHSTF